jgi:RNA polymerase sigma factor (sigma-70 family)
MSSGVNPSYALKPFREDELLVRECLLGSEEAWSDLIDKYRNLIFSIAVKHSFSRDDASELFQAVCLTLLQELSHLRDPRALAGWLIKLTARKCLRWKHEGRAFAGAEIDKESFVDTEKLPEGLLEELEREQMLREAIAEASPECRRLIDLLFFTNPPLSYEQTAAMLGFAKGSIGATRMRCLEKMRSSLQKKGFR